MSIGVALLLEGGVALRTTVRLGIVMLRVHVVHQAVRLSKAHVATKP